MFKKTTNYLKKTAKSVLSSGRLKTLALMLLVVALPWRKTRQVTTRQVPPHLQQ